MAQTSFRMPRKDICTTLAAEQSLWMNAALECVWQAVTDPRQLDLWYAPGSTWDIPMLKVGASVTFHHLSSEILTAIIDVVQPLDEFVLRWSPDQTYPEVIFVTTFVLEEETGGTRVTINECGYSALPEDVRQTWLDSANAGYKLSMENLKAHVEGHSISHVSTLSAL